MTLVKNTVVEFDISGGKKKNIREDSFTSGPLPLKLKNRLSSSLEKDSPKKVDVVSYNIVRGYNKIVFFHLVLQPGKGNMCSASSAHLGTRTVCTQMTTQFIHAS